jgi:hypothetical protein
LIHRLRTLTTEHDTHMYFSRRMRRHSVVWEVEMGGSRTGTVELFFDFQLVP